MAKITPALVMKTFQNPEFIESLELLLENLEKEQLFKPGCVGRAALWQYEKQTKGKIDSILYGKESSGIIHGDYAYDNSRLPSVGVFSFRVMNISQYVQIRKGSILPPRASRITPFFGVSIWLGSDIIQINGIGQLGNIRIRDRDNNSRYAVWPRNINGFPVKYYFGTDTSKSPCANCWK